MHELKVVPEFLAALLAQPLTVILVVLLLIAAVIDWRTYRIPNWLTVGGMVFGLLYNTVAAGPALPGFLTALAGLGVGLAMLLPLYMLRVMGAGDVKLMAMVGAFLGLPGILYAVLFSLVAGGIAALALTMHRKVFRRMTSNVADVMQAMAFAAIAGGGAKGHMPVQASVGKLPYGIGICAGTLAFLVTRQLGFA